MNRYRNKGKGIDMTDLKTTDAETAQVEDAANQIGWKLIEMQVTEEKGVGTLRNGLALLKNTIGYSVHRYSINRGTVELFNGIYTGDLATARARFNKKLGMAA